MFRYRIRLNIRYVVLAILCVCPALGQTQTLSGKTIATSARISSGLASASEGTNPAPHMKVQILNHSNQETTYAVIFGKGDEVLAGLTKFAQEKHIGAARITGIGGIENGTLEYFDRVKKMFVPISIDQQSEVLSMLGDIALFHDKPAIHVHMVLGFSDGSAHGGHLLKAHVWPTLEVIVTEYPNAMHKTVDPDTGLSLIDPSVKR